MKKSIFQGNRSRVWGLVLLAVISVLGISSCRPDFDLDKKTPEWLGPSIYDYLKINHYDTYVKLIEDLGYKDVLSKTGSKTLFVADEEAVQRFYNSGVFKKADGTPVHKYEDLSLGQKKMILYGSMLNNVYQVSMLATASGPTLGESMRRPSSASEFIDVPLMLADSMPDTEYFKFYRENNKNIRILRDGSNKPLIFLINKFLVNHKILDDDYDFLFNQGDYAKNGSNRANIRHKEQDASVNGVNIDVQNIKCLNGFVHKVHDVIYPLPNMAEYLETSSNTKVYYSLLNRFCAPYPANKYLKPGRNQDSKNWDGTYSVVNSLKEKDYREYLAKDNKSELLGAADTLFELRFFSASLGIGPKDGNIFTPSGKNEMDKALKFDPGWNSYYFSGSSETADLALQQNISVMLVPSDKAMIYWWNEGEGAAIKERYAPTAPDATTAQEAIEQMANVEDFVILDLINNNMLQSFTASVPSKFNDVLNDAQDPMDLKTDYIDSVKLCCNGAIYLTNTVMSPTAYKSVSFPTLVNPALRVINWAVGRWTNGASTGCGFFAYLNSMQSKYSFFVPIVTDPSAPDAEKGCLIYLDPVSFGQDTTYAYVFKYDEKEKDVTANYYVCDKDGNITDWSNPKKCDKKLIINRLTDLLDYHIVIGNVEDNTTYYTTKGRGNIMVKTDQNKVYGGYQLENGTSCNILRKYNMANGVTYIIDKPLLTPKKSVYDVITNAAVYPEFSEFQKIIDTKDVQSKIINSNLYISKPSLYASKNISFFNTYYYTVYVPSNESILALVDKGVITNNSKMNLYQSAYEAIKALGFSEIELAMSKVVYDNLSKEDAMKYVTDHPKPTAADNYYSQKYLSFTWKTFQVDVKKRNINFIKMHIQDKSLYVGGGVVNGKYETSYIHLNSIFERINVQSDNNSIKVTGPNGIVRNVSSDVRLRNIMCREYKFKNNDDTKTDPKEQTAVTIDKGVIETSSFAVIHNIDGPLCSTIEELQK